MVVLRGGVFLMSEVPLYQNDDQGARAAPRTSDGGKGADIWRLYSTAILPSISICSADRTYCQSSSRRQRTAGRGRDS